MDAIGDLVEIEGIDELLERMFDTVSTDHAEDLRWRLEKALDNPQVQQMIQNKAVERWGQWVSTWIGLEVTRGTEEVWELDMEVTGGAFPEWHVAYSKRESYRGLECVEISSKSEADEDRLLRQVLQTLGIATANAEEELPDDIPLSRTTRTDTIRGIYAVDGLRPITVHTSTLMRVWEAGAGEPEEQLEEHTYAFEWDDLEEE